MNQAHSAAYTSSLEHLLDEMRRIDLLLQAAVFHMREERRTGDDQLRGLVITHDDIDAILRAKLVEEDAADGADQLIGEALDELSAEIAERKAAGPDVELRLERLSGLFGLSPFESDAVLIALAPELDLRYERLYAYLQDDVTKKRPSVDLALSLLCSSIADEVEARRCFAPSAPLLRHHLIELVDDPSHVRPPLLSKYLKVDERVVGYLLGSDEIDDRLLPHAGLAEGDSSLEKMLLPGDVKDRLLVLAREGQAGEAGTVLYFQGPYGVGKESLAEALCAEVGVGLLVVDGEGLVGAAKDFPFETSARLVAREAILQGAALYWSGFDALFADDRQGMLRTLLAELEERRGLTFLAGDETWEPADALHDVPFVRVELERPGYGERLELWSASLNGKGPRVKKKDLQGVATRFRFSGGQIRDAAATARDMARRRDPANGRVTTDDLYAACRLQSNRKLGTLAQKITPHYRWDDIVLPGDRMDQLREICNHVAHRAQVYEKWGFDGKLALGKGLNVLFAGPSGTGKTMAADILAGELGLDLYKIDLSTVVSKYIGETEKNLSRIFAEAETSNAILFFDEADALFGKRSEVRDAHDRYANIEISYLLQKMEAYEGVAILATNLRKNMDDAFVRRMHFTVEFPFPDEEDRLRIWRGIWPERTPCGDLDLPFMAQRFELAGGHIRNIALAAAFLAADDGETVEMPHLIHATRREYQKMGKVVGAGEFGEYAAATQET